MNDFWEPFDWYMNVEQGIPSTYFLIPFRGRKGECVPGTHASRRAAAYDIRDHRQELTVLLQGGCEVGLHGIDAWTSIDKGMEESAAIKRVTASACSGVRMHWLLQNGQTPSRLERAGFTYDSTCGYNETIGYRAGTSQVFRPLECASLLELPLHIQDGALFYRNRMDLLDAEAQEQCEGIIRNAARFGGVVTILWHDRSHGPERFWGGFYVTLVNELKSSGCWFASAGKVVEWFHKRRIVKFDTSGDTHTSGFRLRYDGDRITPALRLRIHTPAPAGYRNSDTSVGAFIDIPWSGDNVEVPNSQLAALMPCACHNSGRSCI
jgi:hypothetical protein